MKVQAFDLAFESGDAQVTACCADFFYDVGVDMGQEVEDGLGHHQLWVIVAKGRGNQI